MLSRIRVAHKLLLIFLLDMVTVVFLVHVVIQESEISLAFARKERLGVVYLGPLEDAVMSVTAFPQAAGSPGDPNAARAQGLAATRRLTMIDAADGQALATAPVAASAISALSSMMAAGPGAEARQAPATMRALRALIRRVGDSSNLILDPQLDSYYAMAVVLQRVPDLLDTLGQIGAVFSATSVSEARATARPLVPGEQAMLIGLNLRLADIASALQDDLQAGYRGNSQGQLRSALAPPFDDVLRRTAQLHTTLDHVVKLGSIGMAEQSAVSGQLAAEDSAIDLGWGVATRQLDRLLAQRIEAIRARSIGHLVVAAILLSTTLALVLTVAQSIAKPISLLATLARHVRQSNEFSLRVRWRSRDEIGDLVETFNSMLERIQTENLREQELIGRTRAAEAQRSLIESIPTPLVVWRRADQRLLHANAAASDLLGLKTGEGDGLGRWLLPVDRDRLLAALDAHGTVSEFAASCLDASGAQVWTILSALEIHFHDENAVLATITPINERRRIEGELRAAKDQAELAVRELREAQTSLVQAEKLASLGALVAGVAHEINTPVGIGLTAASMLSEEAETLQRVYRDGEMTEEAFEDFLSVVTETGTILVSNMNRAAALIQSFKQVAVDQTSAERRRFLLGDYLREVLQTLAPRLRASKLAISIDCPTTLEIDGYPGALSQVISNLLLNALIHGFEPEQDGQVSIAVDLVSPDLVRLRLSDNGKGIAPAHLSRIFDPFFTTKRASGGSGLGLHVVYNLVSGALQGQITVSSTPGNGTIFTLVFPRIIKVV